MKHNEARIKYLKKHLAEINGKLKTQSTLTQDSRDIAVNMLTELKVKAEKELIKLVEEKKNG